MPAFDGLVKSLLRVHQHFCIKNITWLRPLQVAFKHPKIRIVLGKVAQINDSSPTRGNFLVFISSGLIRSPFNWGQR